MTWDEFKKKVDDELEKLDKNGSEEIWYIDVHPPDVEVAVDDEMGISIN